MNETLYDLEQNKIPQNLPYRHYTKFCKRDLANKKDMRDFVFAHIFLLM